MRRPRPRKKARMTAVHCSRNARSLPTLKVIQVPSPTAGIGSLDDGTARTSGFSDVAWPIAGEGSDAAAPSARVRRAPGGAMWGMAGGSGVIERAEAIATKQTYTADGRRW